MSVCLSHDRCSPMYIQAHTVYIFVSQRILFMDVPYNELSILLGCTAVQKSSERMQNVFSDSIFPRLRYVVKFRKDQVYCR